MKQLLLICAVVALVGCGKPRGESPTAEARKLSGIWVLELPDGPKFTLDLRGDGSGSMATYHKPPLDFTSEKVREWSWDGDEIVVKDEDGHKTWYTIESNGDLVSSGGFNSYFPEKGRQEFVGSSRRRYRLQK